MRRLTRTLNPSPYSDEWPLFCGERDVAFQELQYLQDVWSWLINEHENFQCEGLLGRKCIHCQRIAGDENFGMDVYLQLSME